jgi:hypothetical protein
MTFDRAVGLCASLDPYDSDPVFFPHAKSAGEEAKRICGHCPIRLECLEHALAFPEEYGVWGGLTEGERFALRSPGVRQPPRPEEPTVHVRCGTYSGVSRHRKRNEALCRPCRDAKSAYELEARHKRAGKDIA